jgi:hypothetical protein
MNMNDPQWIGQKFEKLTVIGFEYRKVQNAGRWMWKCYCDCGNETIVYPNQVIHGKTTSCGCNKSRTFREMHYKHGMAGTRLYKIWKGMRRRCSDNPSHNHHYGDRGIKVCSEWDDFLVFHEWAVNNGYTDEMSIERNDPNGNYCPANCSWIPLKEQMYNTRKTIMVTIDDITKPIGQWADEMGIKRPTVYGRISRGMSPKEALLVPVKNIS